MRTLPLLCALLIASPLHAAWYDFAKNESAPEIAELQVAGRQMEDLVELLEVYPDELKGGKMVIRGKASTTRGKIGAVLVSVDGGANFQKARVERSGAFFFDFTPILDKEHELQLKVLDTTGRGSDPKAGALRFALKQDKTRDEALAVFNGLLDLYKAKNRAGFMALVAEKFVGDRVALESGLDADFQNLNSIDITPTILRVSRTEGIVEVQFSFFRKVQARSDGKALMDKSRSSMSFSRENEQMRLYSMAAPLIFGVAASGEVATSVDMAATGDKVLAVTSDGAAVKVEQQTTVQATTNETASNIVVGTLNVNCAMSTADTNTNCPSVALDSRATARTLTYQQQRHARDMSEGEVSVTTRFNEHPPSTAVADSATKCVWVVEPGSRIRDLGPIDINSVKTVSTDEGDYQQAIPADNVYGLVMNRVYAVKTPTLYALLKPTSGTCGYLTGPPDQVRVNNVVFEYRIQLSLNPSFY